MSFRAALHLALWFLLVSALAGCGSLPFQSDPSMGMPVEPKRPPQFRLDVDAPADLNALLLQHLDLARLQYAAEADALTRSEIDRLIGAASSQALSLLQTEGYFNPVLKVQRVDDGAEPPLLRMTVLPGPRATIERLTLEVQGGLYDEVASGDAQAEALQSAVQSEWALQPGQPFTQSAWDSAKNRVLATLRSNGYLGAQWSGTAAQVNAENNTVRLFVVADSGELFRIGSIRTAGLQRFDEAAVLPTAGELIGKPATEQLIRDVQDRLLGLGLFESIIIDVDANSAEPARAQALLALRELPLQQATVGVGYADDTGLQVTLEHTHRRIFDTRWVMHNRLQFGQEQSLWAGDLMSHLQEDGYRNLLAGQAEKLTTNDETRYSWYARVGRTRDTLRIWRLIYGEYTRALLQTSAGDNDSQALSANYHWTWRNVDDLRTPTSGTVWSLQGGAGVTRGTVTQAGTNQEAEDSGPFARLYGRAQGYLPLGNNFYGSARLELGQVFVREALSVPDTLLFRAGGDDSVRGYAYRSLGPEVDGAVVSGSTLLTASLQVARPIFADQPAFLWAAVRRCRQCLGRLEQDAPGAGLRGRPALAQPGGPATGGPGLWRRGAQVPPALQRGRGLLSDRHDRHLRPHPSTGCARHAGPAAAPLAAAAQPGLQLQHLPARPGGCGGARGGRSVVAAVHRGRCEVAAASGAGDADQRHPRQPAGRLRRPECRTAAAGRRCEPASAGPALERAAPAPGRWQPVAARRVRRVARGAARPGAVRRAQFGHRAAKEPGTCPSA